MPLLLNKELNGTVYVPGSKALTSKVQLLADTSILVSEIVDAKDAIVFVQTEKAAYSLGHWSILKGRGHKLGTTDHLQTLELDESALVRLLGILQRIDGLGIRASSKYGSFVGRSNALEFARASNVFLFSAEQKISEEPLEDGSAVEVAVEIGGMEYKFESSVVDGEGNQLALSLPTSGWRQLRRVSPRKSDNAFSVRIEKGDTVVRISDFSPLGLRLELTPPSKLNLWEEIDIAFEVEGSSCATKALVVRSEANSVHLLLSGGNANQKKIFYYLWSQTYAGIHFSEDPEKTWQCLLDFGYLDLLDGGLLRKARENCIAAWSSTHELDTTFQPVAEYEGAAFGTIAAAKTSPDHWIPHALASKVDPKYLPVTESLYLSWPNYLLSQAAPLWFSTWYSANKPWHNRFYQVFIREQEADPDCYSFVRNWFWTEELRRNAVNTKTSIVPLNDINKEHQHLVASWRERYGEDFSRRPATWLRRSKFLFFEEEVYAISFQGKTAGVGKMLTSKHELNPFCVFNSFHLNLFDSEMRKSEEVVRLLIDGVIEHLLASGLKCAALTMDFDIPQSWVAGNGFASFGNIRCLTSHSRLLPALISNNVLTFAEMRSRIAKE